MAAQATPSQQMPSARAPKTSRVARMWREPNAIWMREMRQSARLGRTPWILFSLSLTISGEVSGGEDLPLEIANSFEVHSIDTTY